MRLLLLLLNLRDQGLHLTLDLSEQLFLLFGQALEILLRGLDCVLVRLRLRLLRLERFLLNPELLLRDAQLVEEVLVLLRSGRAVLLARPELPNVGGVDLERVRVAGTHVEGGGPAAELDAQLRGVCLRYRDPVLGRRDLGVRLCDRVLGVDEFLVEGIGLVVGRIDLGLECLRLCCFGGEVSLGRGALRRHDKRHRGESEASGASQGQVPAPPRRGTPVG